MIKMDIVKSLNNFDLKCKLNLGNEVVALQGSSGSGKTTILDCIAGIKNPNKGIIKIDNKTVFSSSKNINLPIKDRHIGYLFQNYALFPNMTVEENIGVGLKISKDEKKKNIAEMIEAFHLQGLEKKYPRQLSGGQQQRVALARCIIYKPDVLMLDEPFSALDTYLKEKLQTEVLDLLKLYKGEVLMVTHSRDEAYRFCENIVVIEKGKSILIGNTKETFKNPKLKEVATLTGCKNISECKIISKNKVYLSDFDITLNLEKEIDEEFKFIGIRAHDFEVAKNREEKNTIEFKINKIVEDLFEYSIIAENINSKIKRENSNIVYKVRKEEWDKRETNEKLYLKISEDKLLFLR